MNVNKLFKRLIFTVGALNVFLLLSNYSVLKKCGFYYSCSRNGTHTNLLIMRSTAKVFLGLILLHCLLF